MDADQIIANWKRRLIALAENPPYVYDDTPQELIDRHVHRLTTFVGYSDAEIATAETRLGVQFPIVFRTFLREMAKSPGDLFRGHGLARLPQFEELKTQALELLAETNDTLTLPQDAVVFLFSQGTWFGYVHANGGFDGPALRWTETEREPRRLAETFAQAVDDALQQSERADDLLREQGGYYLTIHPEGGSTVLFPARCWGHRPLDWEKWRKRWRSIWRRETRALESTTNQSNRS